MKCRQKTKKKKSEMTKVDSNHIAPSNLLFEYLFENILNKTFENKNNTKK